jgi:hypothetical protein
METHLTISHITPYLPYGLRVEVLDYKSDYVGNQYDNVIGVHQWSGCGKLWSCLTKGGAKPSFDRVKPILRPLSDLHWGFMCSNGESLERSTEIDFEDIEAFGYSLNAVTFADGLVLLENHFDIFKLIDQDLAVDINTL